MSCSTFASIESNNQRYTLKFTEKFYFDGIPRIFPQISPGLECRFRIFVRNFPRRKKIGRFYELSLKVKQDSSSIIWNELQFIFNHVIQ